MRSSISTPSVRSSKSASRTPTTQHPHARPFVRTSGGGGGSAHSIILTSATAAAASYRGPDSFPDSSSSSSSSSSSTKSPSKNKQQQSSSSSASITATSTSPTAAEIEAEEVLLLVRLIPPRLRDTLESDPRLVSLIEVVMDLGRPPLARYTTGDVRLSEMPVSEEDLQSAIDACGEFGGDNRAGIDGTLHRISAIRNRAGKIVGLTCRAGRSVEGSAAMVADLATAGKSILFLGRPGVGKTTTIREISRLLADECKKRVVVVDTSNEIGGDGDIPHPGIGGARRMQVSHPERQHCIMIEAVENHMPEVIVIDEIGTEVETMAARTIAQRGVQLVATVHGNTLENVMKNPSLNDLVGGVNSVTLGDEEAKRRGGQKSILERESPPTFDVVIEMESRERWRVHLDVAYAVDELLLGREAGEEVRERDEEGAVWAWPADGAPLVEDSESSGSNDDDDENSSEEKEVMKMKKRRGGQRISLETQPFPELALAAARGLPPPPASVAASEEKLMASEIKGMPKKSSKAAPHAGASLKVYLYGVEAHSVTSIADTLKLGAHLTITPQIQDADAVLATRAKLKASTWIKVAAQQAGVPLFTVKTAAVEHVVKAVRTLLGVDPTPGGLFANFHSSGGEAPLRADPRVASSRTLRAETSIALVRGTPTSAAATLSGLEEARDAIQSIVLQKSQPVELLPRPESVVERQISLAKGYGLQVEVAGTAATGGRRVRILPMDYVSGGGGGGGASGNGNQQAKEEVAPTTVAKKEYW